MPGPLRGASREKHLMNTYAHIINLDPLGNTVYSGPGTPTAGGRGTKTILNLLFIGFEQKGKNIYSGATLAQTAYKLGKVPRMNFTNDPSSAAVQALDLTLTQYQRPLANTRRRDISSWFNSAGINHLATSPLLWLPELKTPATEAQLTQFLEDGHGCIYELQGLVDGIGTVKKIAIPVIDDAAAPAGSACIRVRRTCDDGGAHPLYTAPNNEWFDYCETCGWNGKPGEIIDGQHRISGTALAPNQSTEPIPINVVLGSDFNSALKSKLFTEVSVESTPLNELHQINLKFRSRPINNHDKMPFRSDPQRVVLYEACVLLTQSGILRDRVMILPNSKGTRTRGAMATSTQMIDWFCMSSLLSEYESINGAGSATPAILSDVIKNWFQAVSTSPWGGRAAATLWSTSRRPVGLINKPAQTEVFSRLLAPAIRQLAVTGVPSVADFTQITSYLAMIDVRSGEPMMNLWGSGGQNSRNNLVMLMKSMIKDVTLGTPTTPKTTAPAWISSFPSRGPIDPFTVIATPGLTSADPLVVNWNVTSYDLVNTQPSGPLNSNLQKPSIKIYQGTDVFVQESLDIEATGKTYPSPLTAIGSGAPLVSGTPCTVEITYTNIESSGPPRTESTTFIPPP